MHFGENQLSQSLIGLSPLTTDHPPSFQPRWVRASTTSYHRFTLPMARSLRFGSRTRDYHALFGLAFATTTPHGLISRRSTNSQAHSSKGTLSPQKAPTACKRPVSGTISLPSRGTFHHSLTVLSTIGYQEVFSLTRWSWQIHSRFHGPRATREQRHTTTMTVSSTGLTPPTVWHSPPVRLPPRHSAQGGDPRNNASHNPDHATLARYHTHMV